MSEHVVSATAPVGSSAQPRNCADAITAAKLSPIVAETITRVVRRARLWRREQVEVACELVAHFQDGLEAGVAAEALVSNFGDIRQTARLIRRAKKRNRPWWWRATRRTLQTSGALVLALMLLYVVVAIRFFGATPSVKRDYLSELNKPARSMAVDDRAWPLYRQALVQMRRSVGGLNQMPNTWLPSEVIDARPGDSNWPKALDFLQQHADALALIRAAASKPGLGFELKHQLDPEDRVLMQFETYQHPVVSSTWIFDQSLLNILLPHVGDLRTAARIVVQLDTPRAALEGDAQAVLANLRAAHGLALHVRETPFIINGLVSVSILAMTFEQIGALLAHHSDIFSDTQLRELAHFIAAIDKDQCTVRLTGERLGFEDTLQRIYSDDGNGDGRITWEGMRFLRGLAPVGKDSLASEELFERALSPGVSVVVAGRREMMEQFNRLMNMVEVDAAQPLWLQGADRADEEINCWAASPINRMRYFPIALLMPAVSRAVRNGEFVFQRREAMLVAVALELYRRGAGRWPTSLIELTPTLLPAVPLDRLDGSPLKFRVIDGQPFVYSVGTNRVDDGGEWPREVPGGVIDQRLAMRWIPDAQRAAELGRGDWILWPPPPEDHE